MKKLGQANHDKESDAWYSVNKVKTNQELTEEIVSYFSEISGHFTPIDRTLIPSILLPESPFVSEVPKRA